MNKQRGDVEILAIFGTVALLIIAGLLSVWGSQEEASRIAPALPVVEQKYDVRETKASELVLINQTRKEKGLNELVNIAGLNNSAAEKCKHMVDNYYWSHSGGDRKWSEFVFKNEPSLKNVGEILAKGFNGDADARHHGWLNSPKHYEQIVNEYDYFGSAECQYKDGVDLTVVHFGR